MLHLQKVRLQLQIRHTRQLKHGRCIYVRVSIIYTHTHTHTNTHSCVCIHKYRSRHRHAHIGARAGTRTQSRTHTCMFRVTHMVLSIPPNKYADSLILFSHMHLSLSPTTLYITRAEKSKFGSTTSAPPRLFPSRSKSINTSPPGCTCIRVVSFCFCVLCTCVCTRVCARVCPWYQ